MAENNCPVCRGTDIALLLEIGQMPIHCNLLWPTREEALQAPRGDIQLAFCKSCGHLFNPLFRPELMEYGGAYENSLHFSARFQEYAATLAARLVERYDLRAKTILEIGCGQGDFLRLLCRLGGNRGIGFDPSYRPGQGEPGATHFCEAPPPAPASPLRALGTLPRGPGKRSGGGRGAKGVAPKTWDTPLEQVTFIQDFYSPRYAAYEPDLICCRHVLEHMPRPRDFLSLVRRAIGARSTARVFFEVPNVMFTLRDLGIWDLIYEHPSYFSPSSLAHLFTSCGFEVCDLGDAYAGQFLCIEAQPRAGPRKRDRPAELASLAELGALAAVFAEQYRSKREDWRRMLAGMAGAGRRALVWGAGSKGVTFLNALAVRDQVRYVVDVNPRKQGMYVAGTGQQIVPPEFLRDHPADVVIVMNPIYLAEIQQITHSLGLTPQLIVA
jgi:SAM-dependent methyltransferase